MVAFSRCRRSIRDLVRRHIRVEQELADFEWNDVAQGLESERLAKVDGRERELEWAKRLESEAPSLATSAPSLTTSAPEWEIGWEQGYEALGTAVGSMAALAVAGKWGDPGQWRHPFRRVWAVGFVKLGRSAFPPSVTTLGPVKREGRAAAMALMAKAIVSDRASLGTW